MKLIKLAAAALITLSSLTAQAGFIDIAGGSNFTIPNANLFKANGNITAAQYNFGGNLVSNFDGQLDLKFTYLGAEANKQNTFTVGANSLGNGFSSQGDSFVHSFILGSGDLLDFVFSTTVPVWPNSVANGANVNSALAVSFAVLSLANFKNSPYDAILFFDDTGGGHDDNHDDLIIGVHVLNATQTAVPESSTFVLMFMGLVGLFAARRLKA
jgi:hypothetical protein